MKLLLPQSKAYFPVVFKFLKKAFSKFLCDKSMLILRDQRGLQYEVLMAARYANHLSTVQKAVASCPDFERMSWRRGWN